MKEVKVSFLYSKKLDKEIVQRSIDVRLFEKLKAMFNFDCTLVYYPTFDRKPSNNAEYALLINECFNAINNSDIVIAITYDYHMGTGVLYELEYAHSLGKQIFVCNVINNFTKDFETVSYDNLELLLYNNKVLQEFHYEYPEESVTSIEPEEHNVLKKEIEDYIIEEVTRIKESESCKNTMISMCKDYISRNCTESHLYSVQMDIDLINSFIENSDKLTKSINCRCIADNEYSTYWIIVDTDPIIISILSYLLHDIARELSVKYPKYKFVVDITMKGCLSVIWKELGSLKQQKDYLQNKKESRVREIDVLKDKIEAIILAKITEIKKSESYKKKIIKYCKDYITILERDEKYNPGISNMPHINLVNAYIDNTDKLMNIFTCERNVDNLVCTRWKTIDASPAITSAVSWVLHDIKEELDKKFSNSHYIERITIVNGDKGYIEVQWKGLKKYEE